MEEEQQANREWVRHLLSIRRHTAIRKNPTSSLPLATRDWLRQQHVALECDHMPVMLKCVLAAARVSQQFIDCASSFMRREYRSRYWDWSLQYLALIDFRLRNGTVNVTSQENSKLHTFLIQARKQFRDGGLAQHKEALLSALDVRFDDNDNDNDQSSLSVLNNGHHDNNDKNKHKHNDQSTRNNEDINNDSDDDDDDDDDLDYDKIINSNSRKRKQHQVEREHGQDRDTNKRRRVTPSSSNSKPSDHNQHHQQQHQKYQYSSSSSTKRRSSNYSNNSPTPTTTIPSQSALRRWGTNFVALRRHFKDGAYDVPDDARMLWIWMNAEVARYTTGTLCGPCSGILKTAQILRSEDDHSTIDHHPRIDMHSETFGRSFVTLIDFLLSCYKNKKDDKNNENEDEEEGNLNHAELMNIPVAGRLSFSLMEFVANAALDGEYTNDDDDEDEDEKEQQQMLRYVMSALLEGVDPNWRQARLTRECMARIRRAKEAANAVKEKYMFSEQGYVHVVNNENDDDNDIVEGSHSRQSGKARAKAQVCGKMVSSMIKGMVAELTSSRSKTSHELDAEAWVGQMGVEALNQFAKEWYRSVNC